jgi:HlyD family secretion protein
LKKLIIIGGLVIAALVGVILVYSSGPKDDREVTYMTAKVEKGTLKAEISSSGTLKPLVEVLVGSQVSGTIKELYADFESKVKKDELIALIDPDTFAAKAEQAEADYESAKAEVNKAEVLAEDEMRTLRRKEQLIQKNSISQSEFDTAKTKADAAVAQIAVDKAKVAQMKGKLTEAQLQLKYTRIIAPVDGIVTARSMDIGQTVTASFQTPVLFKIAEDLTRMQVHTNVDEADIGRVTVGQKAVFSVPAFPDQFFEATVNQIRNDPKVEQNVVTYNVILDVENKEMKLRPGMTANVRILLTEVPDALNVPDQVMRFSPPESLAKEFASKLQPLKSGERRIWKLEPEDKLRPIIVKAGIAAAEHIQIISDEVKPGDKMVTEAVIKKKESKSTAIRFKF